MAPQGWARGAGGIKGKLWLRLPSPSLRSAPPPLDKNNGSAGLGSGGEGG